MKSGIYAIENTLNKKRYYGSSKNIQTRWYQHKYKLRKNKHHNQHLQNAWNKYGEPAFEFTVMVYCAEEHLEELEKVFIKNDPTCYNIAQDTKAPMRGLKHSFEAREKIRQAGLGRECKPETREKIRQAHLGTTMPLEAIEKSRQAGLGRECKPETREKIRQANLGKPKSLEHAKNISLGKSGKKQTPEAIEQNRLGHLGKKQTAETIRKRTQSQLGRGKGYSFSKSDNKWRVRFKQDRKERVYGYFLTEQEAQTKAEQVKRELGIIQAV